MSLSRLPVLVFTEVYAYHSVGDIPLFCSTNFFPSLLGNTFEAHVHYRENLSANSTLAFLRERFLISSGREGGHLFHLTILLFGLLCSGRSGWGNHGPLPVCSSVDS